MDEEIITLDNGCQVYGELALMFPLKRYHSSLETLSKLEVHFGFQHTVLSRLGKHLIDRLYDAFSNLLTDNVDHFVPRFPYCNASIRNRTAGRIPAGIDWVMSFIDANVLQIYRPEGNDNIQRCVYNGMNRVHALKLTWTGFPDGLCGNLGIVVGRRNGRIGLQESGINTNCLKHKTGP